MGEGGICGHVSFDCLVLLWDVIPNDVCLKVNTVSLSKKNLLLFLRGISPKETDLLIDDRLYSAILRSLEQTHCACMWFYMSDYFFFFFEYSPKWCTYSAGMAGGT